MKWAKKRFSADISCLLHLIGNPYLIDKSGVSCPLAFYPSTVLLKLVNSINSLLVILDFFVKFSDSSESTIFNCEDNLSICRPIKVVVESIGADK